MGRSQLADYVISAALMLVAALFILGSLGGGESSALEQTGSISPYALPIGTSILLFTLAALLILQTWLGGNRDVAESERERSKQETPKESGRRERLAQSPYAYIVTTVIYLLCLPFLGFFVPTGVLILFCLTLAGASSWVGRLAVSAGFLAFAYLVFVMVLSIPLPVGPWGF